MTFGSLFTGIGGFDIGLERAGMKCLWQVEKDKSCNVILERHWPKVKRHTDVSKFKKAKNRAVDLVCGGFPCQDLSVAGKRAGLAGARSGLFFEFMRIVSEFTPRWVLIENVPGLLSSWSDTEEGTPGVDFGSESGAWESLAQSNDLDTVLNELDARGYGVAWRIFDSQYFGLAQRRNRVFIVGCLGDVRSAAKVLFESDSLPWNPPPSREKRQDVAGTLDARTDAGGFPGSDGACDGHVVAHTLNGKNGKRYDGESETFIAGALQSHSAKHGHAMTTQQAAESNHLVSCTLQSSNGGVSSGMHPIVARCQFLFDGRQCNDIAGHDLAHSFIDLEKFPIYSICGASDPLWAKELAQPQTNRHGDPGQIAGNFGIRRLTPLECERLQGFPDGWTEPLSDSARYRCLGNAVSVPVAKWLGQRILAIEEKL